MSKLTPHERLLIYRNISNYYLRKIKKDKSVYLKFGKVSTEGDPEANSYALKYGLLLNRTKFKHEFDAYKGMYRLTLKKNMMRQAYHKIKQSINNIDRNLEYINYASVPFLRQRFEKKHFSVTTDQFLIILGMYNTYIQTVKFWGLHSLSYNIVSSFSGPHSKPTYNAVIDKMLDYNMIRKTHDYDLHISMLKQMANQHKHPVLKAILREQHYLWTRDGLRIIESLTAHQLDFIDQLNHNATFFQQANIPKDMKDAMTFARQISNLKEPPKSIKQLNYERQKSKGKK
ncbi:MAG: hypothetical protein ACI9DM_002196 [Cyclobacteriaceae bacterium]|jgi:hypothetical protein